jgi:hypothetical protein
MTKELFTHSKSNEEVISSLKTRVEVLNQELEDALEYCIALEKRLGIYRDSNEIQNEIVENSTVNISYI